MTVKKRSNRRGVTHADYVKDPGKYFDRARDRGPVTLTNANGKARAVIVIPKPVSGDVAD